MSILNYEFKARAGNLMLLEEAIQAFHPQFAGTDHQIDTYFNTANGRLKLREGNIEKALIYYERSNTAGAKPSRVLLYSSPDKLIKNILTAALGINVVVEKERRIWFIDNVKFHFDRIINLGHFIEVEAIDKDGSIGLKKLQEQCTFYSDVFKLSPSDFLAESYSDLLMQQL